MSHDLAYVEHHDLWTNAFKKGNTYMSSINSLSYLDVIKHTSCYKHYAIYTLYIQDFLLKIYSGQCDRVHIYVPKLIIDADFCHNIIDIKKYGNTFY